MAELYVKPGNRERGWNDPPQFSYGLQQLQAPRGGGAAGAKRGPLARRVAAAAAEAAAGEREETPPKTTTAATAASRRPPLLPGPAGLPASPPHSVGLLPTPGLSGPSLRADATRLLVSEAEEDCGMEDVLSPLNEALDNCRKTLQKQVCDDIGKRLVILQQIWEQGKLSAPVRKRMKILIKEFKNQHWDTADEIHRSLMVDHVTEVSQWMVGVKRLIAETRNLPTEDIATVDYEQKVGSSLELECLQD